MAGQVGDQRPGDGVAEHVDHGRAARQWVLVPGLGRLLLGLRAGTFLVDASAVGVPWYSGPDSVDPVLCPGLASGRVESAWASRGGTAVVTTTSTATVATPASAPAPFGDPQSAGASTGPDGAFHQHVGERGQP